MSRFDYVAKALEQQEPEHSKQIVIDFVIKLVEKLQTDFPDSRKK